MFFQEDKDFSHSFDLIDTVTLYPYYSIYISTVSSWPLFSFTTFDFFLADLGRNRMYGVFSSAQTAHKPV